MSSRLFHLDPAFEALRKRIPFEPRVFAVLGSGLGGVARRMEEGVSIPFSEIPGFPEPGVSGHEGRLVCGRLGGERVLVQSGRFHLYEGHGPSLVIAPVRLAARLGASVALVTNAAGSLVPSLQPGSLLLLDDHLNLMSRSPLRGPAAEGEDRFPDMSAPYDPHLRNLALSVAREMGLRLQSGVYAAVLGPSYETPAEVRFMARAGADAVGMSTVPEVIAARSLGMRVLAISLITNMAAGLGSATLDHQEVLEMGRVAGGKLGDLLLALLAHPHR